MRNEDLPSDGGSIGEAELRDGDGEPHHADGGRLRAAVHLDVHWRVGQPLGLCPDINTVNINIHQPPRELNIQGKLGK